MFYIVIKSCFIDEQNWTESRDSERWPAILTQEQQNVFRSGEAWVWLENTDATRKYPDSLLRSLRYCIWHGQAKCIVCLSVCVCVPCRMPTLLHVMYHDVTWGNNRGCPLVVHYWTDLQSVRGFCWYGNSLTHCCAWPAEVVVTSMLTDPRLWSCQVYYMATYALNVKCQRGR